MTAIDTTSPVLLWREDFAADPHRAYQHMRERYGSLVPVELCPGISATLVIGYHTAVRILNDPAHFPHDPTEWHKNIPPDCPIGPMTGPRNNAIRTTGARHERYRAPIVAALDGVDLYSLYPMVGRIAVQLINAFSGEGKADILAQYATPLVFTILTGLFGSDEETGAKVGAALTAMFNSESSESIAPVEQMLVDALLPFVQSKRANPADDITSRLIQHPNQLDDAEMVEQLILLYAAGIEPTQNLITNTLLMILTDERYRLNASGMTPTFQSALSEVLTRDTPMHNYCLMYPKNPITVDGYSLEPNQPVLISMAGCNDDPEVNAAGVHLTGDSWNITWSSGPHACPMATRDMAKEIAFAAISQLMDALPDIRIAVPTEELQWRPGPFHHALNALPVMFGKAPELNLPD